MNDDSTDDSETAVTRRDWLSVTGAAVGTAMVGSSATGGASAQESSEPRIQLGDSWEIDDVVQSDGDTDLIFRHIPSGTELGYDAVEDLLSQGGTDIVDSGTVVADVDSDSATIANQATVGRLGYSATASNDNSEAFPDGHLGQASFEVNSSSTTWTNTNYSDVMNASMGIECRDRPNNTDVIANFHVYMGNETAGETATLTPRLYTNPDGSVLANELDLVSDGDTAKIRCTGWKYISTVDQDNFIGLNGIQGLVTGGTGEYSEVVMALHIGWTTDTQ